ncbi:MAG: hypothetical protein HY318_01710 [Armatimonadetes bacterium]|nr:hypothetical protein [Armatimonadota bacterium]
MRREKHSKPQVVGCFILLLVMRAFVGGDSEARGNLEPPSVIFGVNTHSDSPNYLDVPMEVQLDLMRELGVQWIRWDWTETALEGRLPFYDRWVAAAAKRGIRLAPVLGPNKAYNLCLKEPTATLEEIEKAGFEFARRTAAHFKGKVTYWELGNEYGSDLMLRKGDVIPEGRGSPHKVWQWDAPDGSCTWHYRDEMIRRASAIFRGMLRGIREADPKAKTIINEGYLHYGFLDRITQEGIHFDILAWHWYSDMGEDLRAVRMPEDESRKGNTAASFDLITRLRKYGKPVWFNEINRRAGDMGGREAEQAEYLKKALSQLAHAKGVSGFFVYELLDELMGPENPESHYGLLRRKQDTGGKWSIVERKPAFFAFKEALKNLRHVKRQGEGLK